MSDLIQRAQKAKMLAGDLSLPKWQRLSQGLQAFSGLELTGLLDNVREPLEANLARVNQVLARYPLEGKEDYQIIGDDDLQQMLDMVDVAASRAIAAELDRIVNSLDAGVTKLPVEAIREAREHRALMIPRLIEVLWDATSAARTGDVREGNAHFFALFLLTEFRAKEALPVILEAFSLPGELPFDLFGDAVTSTLARVLAALSGDPDLLDRLIRNRALNEHVRWEAAQAYVHLVRDGRLTRDEAVGRLYQHLREAIENDDRAIAGPLVCTLVAFAPEEAYDDIKEAYQRGLVERFMVDLSDVEQAISEGEAWVRDELDRCPDTGIEDTTEELRHWAAFREEPVQRRTPPPRPPHFAAAREPTELATAPASSLGRRVGRNEPCPCGSGRKFKKCCGSRK